MWVKFLWGGIWQKDWEEKRNLTWPEEHPKLAWSRCMISHNLEKQEWKRGGSEKK